MVVSKGADKMSALVHGEREIVQNCVFCVHVVYGRLRHLLARLLMPNFYDYLYRHIHDRLHRRRDTAKCFNQREVTRRRDRETGLNTLRYSLDSRRELTIDGVVLTVMNINLECDKSQTPWCECDSKVDTKSRLETKAKT